MSLAFAARYPGKCAAGDSINIGDNVQYDNDDELIHHDCIGAPPADENTPQRNERMCPDCNMVHAGECDW